MATGEQAGLLDLQKELTCSICTEVLFQPLTLLDCLHTFCGSCLKEWFSWQASQASASKPNPYTCPSCRASVRETRPNATVTTLLDMYLQANPGRGRTQEEQEDLKARYKPGEQVLPQVTVEKADAADERMLAEVREMSLRDVGVRGPASYEHGTRRRTAERRRDSNNGDPQGRRHQQANSHPGRSEANAHRQIGHQSSLRSLMSSSDIDSSEMEEEILRLVDEGWLDGIDLNNLDTSQVDELSERIAEAYRRRHGHRSGSGDAPTEEDSRRSRNRPGRSHRERSSNSSNRPITDSEQGQSRSHPPVSRPRLLEAYPISPSQQRRASSEQRRQTSPSPRSSAGRLHPASQNQASRSATDLSERPPSSTTRSRPTELSGQGRRITDPDHISTPRSRARDRSEPTTVEQTIPANNGNSSTSFTGTAQDVMMASTIFACDAIVSVEGAFTGMALDTHRCKVAHKLFLNFPASNGPNSSGGTTIVPALGPRSSSNSHFLGLSPPNHYVPLTLSTKCNICRYPIPPSSTRFHCPQCNGGDFNICTTSYMKLISAGHVSVENGDKGWRKCFNGHRMTVVGFEDSSAGQRRVVVQDLVGGLGLKNDGGSNGQAAGQELSWQEGQQRHVRKVFGQDAVQQERDLVTTTAPLLRKYPPSGGTGMHALAVWGYWPENVASDELSFPRGAEVREVEDINGDWFIGSYAGKMGLFPGNHVRVLDNGKP
ncbi:MAG: hypothetical protein Q9182_002953 [Xanthomendoza sp. 2 TL-2023]